MMRHQSENNLKRSWKYPAGTCEESSFYAIANKFLRISLLQSFELIQFGDFQADDPMAKERTYSRVFDYWSFGSNGTGDNAMEFTKDGILVDLADTPSSAVDFNLTQQIPLMSGVTYELSFSGTSSVDRDIRVELGLSAHPHTPLLSETFSFFGGGRKTEQYKTKFTIPENFTFPTDKGELSIQLGRNTEGAMVREGVIRISHVSVKAVQSRTGDYKC